jgi:hypothetical protein
MQIVEVTTESMQDPSKRYRCRYIFTDGHRCGSPSLRGEHFCYYHHTSLGSAADIRARREWTEFELPLLEDRSSVLAAVTEVLQRIACDKLPSKQAGLLLYGLQIASQNLPETGEAKTIDEEDQPEEVIANHRYGDLAPVAEIFEDARPAIASAETTDANEHKAPQMWLDAPSFPEQHVLPPTQLKYRTPQPPRLFVGYGRHNNACYRRAIPEPTQAESAILPDLQASADSPRPSQLQRSHRRKCRSNPSEDEGNTRKHPSGNSKNSSRPQKHCHPRTAGAPQQTYC